MWNVRANPTSKRDIALATLLAQLFPQEMTELFTWCDQQWTVPMAMGRWEVFSMAMIWSELTLLLIVYTSSR